MIGTNLDQSKRDFPPSFQVSKSSNNASMATKPAKTIPSGDAKNERFKSDKKKAKRFRE